LNLAKPIYPVTFSPIGGYKMQKSLLRIYITFFVFIVVLIPSGRVSSSMICETASVIGPRPSTWAVQMKSTCNVPNFYKINNNLYRSAQPTAVGMEQLRKQIGIKTIINLRTFHSDADEIGSTALLNERLQVKAWHIMAY